MELTIQKLARLAGVSARTLRYYHQIGLLSPARVNSAGYRIYGQREVDALQQILFDRAMGMRLENIQKIMQSPAFDRMAALKGHLAELERRQTELSLLLQNVRRTILEEEGKIKMSNQEKFIGLKERLIEENQKKYGAELIETYGKEQVEKSNRKWRGLTQAQYGQIKTLEEELLRRLEAAVAAGISPAGDEGRQIAALHQQWLRLAWDGYSEKAHSDLAGLYVADGRFTAYYDKRIPGCAAFLRDAIRQNIKVDT